MQHNGLGTILLGQLIEAADQAGVAVLNAEVLPQNHRMLHVFRDSGFPVTTRTIPGVVLVELLTSLSPGAANAASRPRASALRRRHIGSLAELTNRKLRRSTHRSVAELEADLTA
jgi:hypothetical protein